MEDVLDRRAFLTLHGVREKRRSRPGGRRLRQHSRDRGNDGGASIERQRGRLSGRPRDRTTGRQRPRVQNPNRRSACPVSSVPSRCLAPTRERMGCREARHASVSSSRDGGVGLRRSSKDGRAAADRFSITSTERSAKWVSVSTVSVADAGRTHLRPCGPDCESGLDDVKTLKRGVEPERDRQDVRGLVARRHSNVSTHAE